MNDKIITGSHRIFILLIVLIFSGCGEIDNYKAPDAVLYGKIITEIGNKVPQRVQNSAGLRFALYEMEAENSLPQYFYAKPDGTFENRMLFSGNYKIRMEQTNFYPVDDLYQYIDKNTEYNFTVTPFCEVRNVEVSHIADAKIRVKFELHREKDKDCKILNYSVYGHVSPVVDDIPANWLVAKEVICSEENDNVLLNQSLEMILDMNDYSDFHNQYAHIVKANQNLIYIRISVKTAFPYTGNSNDTGSTYVNFSDIIPVAITF